MRLIDADALMAQFDIWDECDELFVQSIRTEIEHAPTIEPERKKGKWIDIACPNCGCVVHIEPERKTGKWIRQNPLVDTEECSECGYNIISQELETPFCPWCGADMRGDPDD